MSQPIPMQTPLAELLRGVPKDHRTEWEIQWAEDGTPTGHALCPIGKLCHEAADELDSLRTQLAEAKAEVGRLNSVLIRIYDTTDDLGAASICVANLGALQTPQENPDAE